MRRFLRPAVLLAGVISLLAAPSHAAAYTPLTPGAVVQRVNALRIAHGFPGRVVERPTLSTGCKLHNRWMQLNRRLQHDEIPGTRGYTSAGDLAGNTSVLANAGSWRTGSPWLNAPMHLAGVLQPTLTTTGASEHYGYNCMVTAANGIHGGADPVAHTLYSFPGPRQTAPFYQLVYEAPFAPQVVHPNPIPGNRPTGPNIILFYGGPLRDTGYEAQLASFRLIGPSGLVATKLVRSTDIPYLPGGSALLIPRSPLEPNATYRLATTWKSGDRDAATWTSPVRTFRTTARRLCGAGGQGWYREADCPRFGARIAAATGPRIASRAQALRGIAFAVRATPRATLVGTARVGSMGVGRGTARASSRGTARVLVRFDARKLDAQLAAAGGPVTVAVTFQAGMSLRTVRVRVAA